MPCEREPNRWASWLGIGLGLGTRPGAGRGLERWASLVPGGKAARMSVSHCLERSLGEGLGLN